jgi:two-component system response regulator DevR
MAPFVPFDESVQWDLSHAGELAGDWSVVFGSPSAYEAYLFCWVFKRLQVPNLLGAGSSEKEVEDLVASFEGPVGLLLVDGISKDAGVGLVRRVREKKPETRAMLLVNSLEAYRRNPEALTVFNGLVSASSVGKGGLSDCIAAVQRGEHYLDEQLREAESGESRAWNDLSPREREILPLLAKGLKNKEVAAELFIAETTTRDYVSSILSKLQVSNRAAAAAWAIEHGFVGT